MATLTTPSPAPPARKTSRPAGETRHRILLGIAMALAATLIVYLAVTGFPYYMLRPEQRPFSPLHAKLRPSGTIGLKLGIGSAGLFCLLMLYPLRKRWRWLSTIGSTRRWLNFHILLGITTPIVVTFHTSFKWHGLAGLAYWIMISVALSGLVGRYLYARIPRSRNAVKLSLEELAEQSAALAAGLAAQPYLQRIDFGTLADLPSAERIQAMGLGRALWTMLRMDVARPFQMSRLRRRLLGGSQRVRSLGGLVASHDPAVESIVSAVRKQARLRTAMAFLDRTERVFHMWHVIHRPFSISFVALILIHIGVAISVGF
jgi:hypothetical protein